MIDPIWDDGHWDNYQNNITEGERIERETIEEVRNEFEDFKQKKEGDESLALYEMLGNTDLDYEEALLILVRVIKPAQVEEVLDAWTDALVEARLNK